MYGAHCKALIFWLDTLDPCTLLPNDLKSKNYEFHKKLGFFNKYSNISSSNKAFKNINNEKKDCWIVNPETTSSVAEGELEFDNSKSNQFVSYKPTNGPMDMILKRYSQRLNHFTTQLDKKNINTPLVWWSLLRVSPLLNET